MPPIFVGSRMLPFFLVAAGTKLPLMVGRPGSFPFVSLVLFKLAQRFIDYAIDHASVIGMRMIRILLPLGLGAKVGPQAIG
ncbi:hypothetical protein [Bradyrhizobium sp. B117]|uniref:hypothetical protein n=1 Tax=Bradyrhizobium sp. B117 TaxID=3140246 RepID=UPI003183738E